MAPEISKDQGSNASRSPAGAAAATHGTTPSDASDAKGTGAGLAATTAAGEASGSGQPAKKSTAVKTCGGRIIAARRTPTATAAEKSAKSAEGSASPVSNGCSKEWGSGAADDTSVDTGKAGVETAGTAAAAKGLPGTSRQKRAVAGKGQAGAATRTRGTPAASAAAAAAAGAGLAGSSKAAAAGSSKQGKPATAPTAAAVSGGAKSGKKALGKSKAEDGEKIGSGATKGKDSRSSLSGKAKGSSSAGGAAAGIETGASGKGKKPAAAAGAELKGSGKRKNTNAANGSAAGEGASGKRKRAAPGSGTGASGGGKEAGGEDAAAGAAEVDWEGLAAAAGVDKVAMVKEKPLWEVQADDVPLVKDGDMQKYLFECATSYAAGKEPFRVFEGVKVAEREEEGLTPEAQGAVKECQQEYWKQYRLVSWGWRVKFMGCGCDVCWGAMQVLGDRSKWAM